jgi:putative aldouronate transport system substrate-binding protein
MKKFFFILSLLSLSAAVFAGGGRAASASASTYSKTPGQESDYWGTYSPPITVTANIMTQLGWKTEFPTGETWDDNTWTRYVAEKYGIKFVSAWVATDNDMNNQRMNLSLVNNSLPDLVNTRGNQLAPMVAAGKLMPLDDLFDKYGSPLVKYIIEEFNQVSGGNLKAPFTVNGKLYLLPWLADIWALEWYHNWVRTDYLAELNMKMPTTLAEFETVMTAYKARHPNGIALVLAAGNQDSLTGMEPVMEAYGAFPGAWLDDGKGGLKFGTLQPEVKQGLAKLAEWYKKGWVDQEFVVKDNGLAETRISSGETILWHAPWWAVWHTIPTAEQNDPKATYSAIPSFLRADGKRLLRFNTPYSATGDGFAISTDCKNPEAIIRLFNLTLEYALAENVEIRKIMKERYNYTMFDPPVDTSVTPRKWNRSSPYLIQIGNENPEDDYNLSLEERDQLALRALGNTLSSLYGFIFNQLPTQLLDQYKLHNEYSEGRISFESLPPGEQGAIYAIRGATTRQDAAGKIEVLEEKNPNTFEALMTSVRLYNQTYDNKEFFLDKFVGSPTPSMIDNNAYLNKLTMETFSKIIMGQAPVDSFDTFVKDWLSAGGQKIVDEVNVWYKSTK